MGFAPENQVRTGLPAGGKEIRTRGPSPRGRSRLLADETGRRSIRMVVNRTRWGGPAVRIPLAPAASPFSPVRRVAAGKEPRAFSNSLGWQVAAALVKPLACLSDRLDGNWPRGPEARSRARGICLRRKRQGIFLKSPSS